MNLTLEQIAELAPDPSAAAAGKSLSAAKHWPELGRSETALWGKCQGSTVYQVKVDLAEFAYNCTCPSRKFPCKHVLGVLMLAAQSPEHVKPGDPPPEWVAEWLEKRRAREEKVAAPAALKPVPDAKAKQRRSDERAQKGPGRSGTARSLAQRRRPRGGARAGRQTGFGMGRASQAAGRRAGAGTCCPRGAARVAAPIVSRLGPATSGRAGADQTLVARLSAHRSDRAAPGKRNPPDARLERHAGSARGAKAGKSPTDGLWPASGMTTAIDLSADARG